MLIPRDLLLSRDRTERLVRRKKGVSRQKLVREVRSASYQCGRKNCVAEAPGRARSFRTFLSFREHIRAQRWTSRECTSTIGEAKQSGAPSAPGSERWRAAF